MVNKMYLVHSFLVLLLLSQCCSSKSAKEHFSSTLDSFPEIPSFYSFKNTENMKELLYL